MLHSLSIRNFILIEELYLEFHKGLCVITGETGAGKSILLKALLFCLNGKLSGDVVRVGTDTCAVTAVFTLGNNIKNLLLQLQIEHDDELIIKRIQTSDNRKKFLVNDQIVTAKTVTIIADSLFELHGQNTHTSLLNPSSHINLLDDYGNLIDLRKSVANKYHELQNIKSQLLSVADRQQEYEREVEYLQFVVDELTEINVQIGEEDNLTDLRRSLQNRDKELQLFHDLLLQLETPSLHQTISRANRIISRINQEDQRFASIRMHLDETSNNIEEAVQQLKHIIDNISDNKHNIEEVEERLFIIKGLVRKYGMLGNQLPEFLTNTKLKLSELQQKIASTTTLEEELHSFKREYLDLAQILSTNRTKVAISLEAAMQQELALLQMGKVLFKVELNSKPTEITINGIDEVRFTASTNPGQPFAAIDKIASGGELSRFMLALKSTLVEKNIVPLVIFDEIDVGVSGAVADSIGDRLALLAKTSQIITITHQPQVAAKAEQHLLVSKIHSDKHTNVTVCTLTEQERVQALAKMIAGKVITENSIKAAHDLRAYKN